MLKKYLTIFIAVAAFQACAYANDAVFSDSEAEQFTLQPLNHTESQIQPREAAPAPEALKEVTGEDTNVQQPTNSQLSNSSYLSAITHLDNATIELREQISNTTALMAQAKTEYLAKKAEYNGYKKQCSVYKKKMRNVEASKKKIQENVNN